MRGAAKIGVAVGAVLDKHKMAKHFELTIADAHFAYRRKTNQIVEEAALDGLYAVRTSLPDRDPRRRGDGARLQIAQHGGTRLSLPEDRRSARSPDPSLVGGTRPRSRVPLHARLLSGMESARPPRPDALRRRRQRGRRGLARQLRSPRRNARPAALAKSATGRTADGAPVHSFQSLLADLATLARNTIVTAIAPDRPFTVLTRPTPIQQKAFDLLAIPIACTQ